MSMEYKRLTEKTIGCFEYDLKDFKHKIDEFNDYDAFFAYLMAVKRLGELESNPDDKKLNRQYKDVCEKMRMVLIMRRQRLELFREAGEHLNENLI